MKLNNNDLKNILLFCAVVTLITTVFMQAKFRELFIKRTVHVPMKYILLWTNSKTEPFLFMREGREGFLKRNCSFTNCYVTSNKTLLGEEYTAFDVIAFYGSELALYPYELPKKRSPHQKYVFASIESPHNYPLCSEKYNNFFNWTWTYKLDSDVRWGYITIRDKNNTVIGPKKDMHWMNISDMNPVSEELRNELSSKRYLVAWIVSSCESKSKREVFVNELYYELKKLNYKYLIHIYGNCGDYYCTEDECYNRIKKSYYFYLALENSFSKDYVTEKILIGLKNNAVPIVYGGANYTMFMPDGIYLDAMKVPVKKLAQEMHAIATNRTRYEEYFKWQNHYSYHRTEDSIETNEYCLFCKILNDEGLLRKKSVVGDFISWWNLRGLCSTAKFWR